MLKFERLKRKKSLNLSKAQNNIWRALGAPTVTTWTEYSTEEVFFFFLAPDIPLQYFSGVLTLSCAFRMVVKAAGSAWFCVQLKCWAHGADTVTKEADQNPHWFLEIISPQLWRGPVERTAGTRKDMQRVKPHQLPHDWAQIRGVKLWKKKKSHS